MRYYVPSTAAWFQPSTADVRRRYALGERLHVNFPADKLEEVVFLVQGGIPRASGFIVGIIEDAVDPPLTFAYVVTARHCVEATKGDEFNIRLNVKDHYDDIPTRASDWFTHPSADVAAVLWGGGPSPQYDLKGEGLHAFIPKNYRFPVSSIDTPPGNFLVSAEIDPTGAIRPGNTLPVEVGNEVMFASLLIGQAGHQRNLPVVRFGHISRMPGEPILLKTPTGTVPIEAYLAECHSWGGHSGSPCYWVHHYNFLIEIPDPRPGRKGQTMLVSEDRQVIALLGLVSAHWDIEAKVKTTGGIPGEVRTAINSGMAVVTPAEAIKELLMSDDVARDRVMKARKAREKDDEARAVTPDFSAHDDAAASSFDEALRRATRITSPPKSGREG